MKRAISEMLKHDDKTLTLPNLISISRLIFLPFIIIQLGYNTMRGNLIVIFLMVLSGLTDYIDGFLARKMNLRSNLGRMLDPLVDKINIGVIFIFLSIYRTLPFWFVLMVIARDAIILTASLHLISKARRIGESNLLGKYTLVSYIMVMLSFVFQIPVFSSVILAISAILTPISLFKYFKIYKNIVGKKNQH
ncbi:CDP-diacylglycerol--glycerol-3-phosphate 3-phosphatidyltransferase [candidate division KSB1 bacterium]|nr:CDP-diacylglycerol--glycerol-3-phosphate 3-phosphatidyltransferase [candidate division KSB1 bacterium]